MFVLSCRVKKNLLESAEPSIAALPSHRLISDAALQPSLHSKCKVSKTWSDYGHFKCFLLNKQANMALFMR